MNELDRPDGRPTPDAGIKDTNEGEPGVTFWLRVPDSYLATMPREKVRALQAGFRDMLTAAGLDADVLADDPVFDRDLPEADVSESP